VKVINHPHISIDPTVCHGKPVITGTRVLVSNILGELATGQTARKIIENYPNITEDDVRACLDFASSLAQFETVSDSVAAA
jgi:uncharacterized protein (DUF433 family)